jgi:hypothetical protein
VEVIGAETMYGANARCSSSREVMMRVTVTHPSKEALELFAREIAPSGTSWSPGTTMPPGGRPSPSPLIRQFSCLISKSDVVVSVTVDGQATPVDSWTGESGPLETASASDEAPAEYPSGACVSLPLIAIAYSRSGDKGDKSNIGVIARRPEYLPLINSQLTAAAVQGYFAHLVSGTVRRYPVPGIDAVNFVLDQALPGGGSASLRMDPLGKGMAQMLLDFEIKVPQSLAAQLSQDATRAHAIPEA